MCVRIKVSSGGSHAADTGSGASYNRDRETTKAELEGDSRTGAGVLLYGARPCAACRIPTLSYRLCYLPQLSALEFTWHPTVYRPAELQHHSLPGFGIFTVCRRHHLLCFTGRPGTRWTM